MTKSKAEGPDKTLAAHPIASLAGQTLAACLRQALPDRSWAACKQLCASGKVVVDGQVVLDPALRVGGSETITLHMNARRRDRNKPAARILFEDPHLIVIDKPEDVSTVPWDPKDSGTALDLIREAWRQQKRAATQTPLLVVHRLDKDTSGVLTFAKTKLAERGLHRVFKNHEAERMYVAVAHGIVRRRSFSSNLVEDRGDGLRGSTPHADQGRHAVTHVVASHVARLARTRTAAADGDSVSRCQVRLETGRTHQIRIHFAESGHPLVGETVYVRDFRRHGSEPLPAARLLLHAQTLAFTHPVTGRALSFEAPPPASFEDVWRTLTGESFDAGRISL